MINLIAFSSNHFNLFIFKILYSNTSAYFYKLVRSIINFPRSHILWPLTLLFILSYPSIFTCFSSPNFIRWQDFTTARITSISDSNVFKGNPFDTLYHNGSLIVSQVWLSSTESNVLSTEFLNQSLSIQNEYLLKDIHKYSFINQDYNSFQHNNHMIADDTVYVYSILTYWDGVNNNNGGQASSNKNTSIFNRIQNGIKSNVPLNTENFIGGITKVNGVVSNAKVLKLSFIYRDTSKSELICKKIDQNIYNYISLNSNGETNITWIQDYSGGESPLLKQETIDLKLEKLTNYNKFILYVTSIIFFLYISIAFFSIITVRSKIGLLFAFTVQLFLTFFASASITSYITGSTSYLEIPVELLITPLFVSSIEVMFRLLSPTIILKDSIYINDKFIQLVTVTGIKSGIIVIFELISIFLVAWFRNQSSIFTKSIQYCIFVGLSLAINYLLHITFFTAILSVDLVRLEASEILNASKTKFQYFMKKKSNFNDNVSFLNNEKLSTRLYFKLHSIKENLNHYILQILLSAKLPFFNNLCYEIFCLVTIVSICLNWLENGVNFEFFSNKYDSIIDSKLQDITNNQNFFHLDNYDILFNYFPIGETEFYNINFQIPRILLFSDINHDNLLPDSRKFIKKLLSTTFKFDFYYLMEFSTLLTFILAVSAIIIKFNLKNIARTIYNDASSSTFLVNGPLNPTSLSAMFNFGNSKFLNNSVFSKSLYDNQHDNLLSHDLNNNGNATNNSYDEKFSSVELTSSTQSLDVIKIASNKICPFIVSIAMDRQVLIWSPAAKPLPQPMTLPIPNNLWPITHSIISMHGNLIAVFSRKGVVKIWSRLNMDWIRSVEISELKNSVPLESFFRRKTILGNLRRKQQDRAQSNTTGVDSRNKTTKNEIKRDRSRRNSISSLKCNNEYESLSSLSHLNSSNSFELSLVLKSGKIFTIDFSIDCNEEANPEADNMPGKEKRKDDQISNQKEKKEEFTINVISKEPLVTSKLLISSRVNDRLISATASGKIIVATVVNNKWRIRTLFIQENRYNQGKRLMTPLAMQRKHMSILSTNLYSGGNTFSTFTTPANSPTRSSFSPSRKSGTSNNSDYSRRSSISSVGSMTNTEIPKQVTAEDLQKSVIVPVGFVGMIVRTRGLIADLIDVQTGTLVKQFHIGQFKSGTFKIFHDQPTHCKFCGCASISSFSMVYTELETGILILHTFSNEGRAKNSICLRVERDPRETRCLGFDAVNEQQHWLDNVEVWDLTELNMVEGIVRNNTDVQKGEIYSGFSRYMNNPEPSILSNRKKESANEANNYKISESWKGFTMSASGVVNFHEIPEGSSQGLLVKKLRLATRFGHKAIVVPFGNIMKVLYLGNDELIITSNLDEDGNSNQKLSGLSFVNKRRMRHNELMNSKNFTELPNINSLQ